MAQNLWRNFSKMNLSEIQGSEIPELNKEKGANSRHSLLDDVQIYLMKYFTETGVNINKITPATMRNILNNTGLPDILIKSEKDNLKSVEFRLKGNEYYKSGNLKEALQFYNKSLCFAEPESENLGYAYANRSAVYFKLNRFETSMKNIRLAKKFNYPDQLMPKLAERKDKCAKKIKIHRLMGPKKVQRKDDTKLKLSYEGNLKNPCVVDRIKMEQRPGFGRCLVATDNLKVGDIIISDQTFYDGYYDSSVDSYLKCEFCGAENFYDLIPCPECTTVMYCDEKCQREAHQNYHKFECSMIDGLMDYIGFRDLYMQSIRIFWSVINYYQEDLTRLSSILKKEVNPLEINYEKDSFEDTFLAFYSYKLIDGDAYKAFTVNASVLFKLISDYSPIKEKITNQELNRLLCELLCNITRIVNIVEFFDSPGKINVWPVISLINHACYPNAILLNNKDKSWKNIVVKRPIKKGEQITISYKSNLIFSPTEARQQECKNRFYFNCLCDACQSKYLGFDQSQDDKEVGYELLSIINAKGSPKEKARKLKALIEKNDKIGPSRALHNSWIEYFTIVYTKDNRF